jgi:protein involved in polysaccharide export with SLBB domain
MTRSAFAILLLCLSLVACSGAGVVRERPLPQTSDVYQLDTGDKLRVTVFGQTDLSGLFAVDATGAVSLPMIQPVQARGRTAEDLQAALAAELGKTLLRNPNVSIQIAEFRPFFILGEVQRAGQYPYVSGMTIQSAVAIAGGFGYRANDSTVRVTRRRDGKLIELNSEVY